GFDCDRLRSMGLYSRSASLKARALSCNPHSHRHYGVHFELRRTDLTCLHHQNKYSGKYSPWSSGTWWNHTCTRTDSIASTFTLATSGTFLDTLTFTFFDIPTFADA